jgi:hypothetical protein
MQHNTQMDSTIKQICERCLTPLNGALGRDSSVYRSVAQAGTGASKTGSVLRKIPRNRAAPLVGQGRSGYVPLPRLQARDVHLAWDADSLPDAWAPPARRHIVFAFLSKEASIFSARSGGQAQHPGTGQGRAGSR